MKIYKLESPNSKRGWADSIRPQRRMVWSALKQSEVPVEKLPGVAAASFMTKPAKGVDIVGGGDGFLFSERFRGFCLEKGFSGIEFHPTISAIGSVAPVEGWYWARNTAGVDIDTDVFLANGQKVCPVTMVAYTPVGGTYIASSTRKLVLLGDPPADFFGTTNILTRIIMFTENVYNLCLDARFGGFIATEIGDSQ